MEKKYIIIIAIVVVVLVLAVAGIVIYPKMMDNYHEKKDMEMRKSWQEERAETTDITIENNDFPFYNKDNKEFNTADFKDKPIFIIFWNSKNEDSVELIKRADSLYDSFKDDINFLLISTDQFVNESLENEINAPLYYDFYQEAVRKLELEDIPAIITIDKEGNIKNAKGGLGSTDMLEANLEILAEGM